MGTRLTILDEQDNILYYGSKLVGYEDSERLSCLKYLWDIRSGDLIRGGYYDFTYFAQCMEAMIVCDKLVKLSIPELKGFLRLYDDDLVIHGREYLIAEEVEEVIPADVEYVWIEWG